MFWLWSDYWRESCCNEGWVLWRIEEYWSVFLDALRDDVWKASLCAALWCSSRHSYSGITICVCEERKILWAGMHSPSSLASFFSWMPVWCQLMQPCVCRYFWEVLQDECPYIVWLACGFGRRLTDRILKALSVLNGMSAFRPGGLALSMWKIYQW